MADMTCAIALISLLAGPSFQEPSALPKKPIQVSKVTDISGKSVPLLGSKSKATLLFVVAVDCPIANRMAPEIARIINDYRVRGVDTWMVYPDKSLKSNAVSEHLASYGIVCRSMIDRKHELVKAVGATVTPQAIILDSKGVVRYLGRINDLYAEHGRTNPKPKKNDLRDALEDFLAGRSIKTPVTEAIGCYISD